MIESSAAASSGGNEAVSRANAAAKSAAWTHSYVKEVIATSKEEFPPSPLDEGEPSARTAFDRLLEGPCSFVFTFFFCL